MVSHGSKTEHTQVLEEIHSTSGGMVWVGQDRVQAESVIGPGA